MNSARIQLQLKNLAPSYPIHLQHEKETLYGPKKIIQHYTQNAALQDFYLK